MSTPPPPPPHGERPRTSGLPPGKYEIFVIPEHSAGAGFLYLPSLKPSVNSFFAGFASALILVALFQSMAPAFRAWWETFQGLGNMGITLLILGVGFGAWALGRTQKDTPPRNFYHQSSYNSEGGSGSGTASGGFGSSSAGASPNGGAHARGHGGAPPPPPPHSSPPPPPPGGGGPQPQSRAQSPPPSSHTRPPSPSPRPASPPRRPASPPRRPASPPRRPASPPRRPASPRPPPPPPPPPPEQEKPKPSQQPSPPPPQPEKPKTTWQRPPPQPSSPKPQTPKGTWEKAREETRKKEEERKAKEAEQKRREEAAKRLAELRAKEARERQEREKEKERKEKELKDQKLKEEAEQRRKELAERLKREREQREKEKEELKKKEEAAAASAAATSERATRAASSYANSGVGEKTTMWPTNQPPVPPQPASPGTSRPKEPPSPRKNPPAPTARTYVTTPDEDAYSYRPYDQPKKKNRRPSMSSYTGSDVSWAQSHTTARTSPPPSVRGPYTTKDPDKIVIQAVYLFMNQYSKTPASQLVSGIGSVTDGLILRITTEGLFIDDDVRGVPQREWDVKAWTLKLVEVWCPPHCLNAPASATSNASSGPKSPPHLLFKMATARRHADRDNQKVLNGDEADAYLNEMLRACKDCCRLGLCERTFKNTNIASSTGQTGAWKFKGLHILRATVRDQEGKRYMFVMNETESWKLAFGLQRLRGGTQVRQLGVAGMTPTEARGTLEMLGWSG